MEKIKRWLPILIIVVLMVAAYATGITKYFSFETLQTYRREWVGLVSEHWLLAPLAYIGLYILVAALSLPVGLFLSLAGGFFFPQPWSTLYIVIGATIGATIVFLAAKTAFGDLLRKKAGPLLQKMETGFQKDAVSYLLFLRLVPLFPFWLVNLAPALFGIRLRTFIWTTFVGIIPGSFVFAQAGTGLGAILDAGGGFSFHSVLNLQVKIALVALGIFALLPILIKRLRKNK